MGRKLKDISDIWPAGETMPVSDIRKILDKIEAEYGPEALICLDSGRNSILAKVVVKA